MLVLLASLLMLGAAKSALAEAEAYQPQAAALGLTPAELAALKLPNLKVVSSPVSIPIDVELPQLGQSSIQLSPEGTHVAMLHYSDGEISLVSNELFSDKHTELLRISNVDSKITWFTWANNERLLLSVATTIEQGGQLSKETHLLSINRDDKTDQQLVARVNANEAVSTLADAPYDFKDRVISLLPNDPAHVLLSMDMSSKGFPAVYRYNIYSGQRIMVQRSMRHVRRWLADQQGRVRVGLGFHGTHYKILIKDLETARWKKVWQYKTFAKSAVTPLGFGRNPNMLYVRAMYQGRNAVYSVDLNDKRYSRELVVADAHYDIDGALMYSPKNGDVIGINYIADTERRIYFDDSFRLLERLVSQMSPSALNSIVSFSRDELRYLIYAEDQPAQGTYYLMDVAKGKFSKVLDNHPAISKYDLLGSSPGMYAYAPLDMRHKAFSKVMYASSGYLHNNRPSRKPISYTSRDGVKIEGYLTLPAKLSKARNLPTIVHPHGGPAKRDALSLDYITKFMVARGYAVLQMNFRGSSGYGDKFLKAGLKKWGLAMQDDITDGVRWLIRQGIADPERICIVGASYGGYAAMMGAVKTPDLYRCAVSYAGVSDLISYVDQADAVKKPIVKQQIGTKRKQLASTSPINLVDAIKIPILLAHGDNDRVVPLAQSSRMAERLEQAGKPFELLVLSGTDHNLSRARSRATFLKRLEGFLFEHLGDARPSAHQTQSLSFR